MERRYIFSYMFFFCWYSIIDSFHCGLQFDRVVLLVVFNFYIAAFYHPRYADRAKKIKNKAVVNENPMDKLIRELREENDKLKKFLEGGGVPMQDVGGSGGGSLTAEGMCTVYLINVTWELGRTLRT